MADASTAGAAPATPRPDTARAAAWMAGWLSALTLIAVAGREAARHMHVFQMMELRSVIGFFMLAPLVQRAGGLRAMRSARPAIHLGRNVVHYAAQFSWFYAITLIPLGQVVAIEFTMPIWTAILATTFLGERMTIWKVAAIVLGLVGVLVIVRPAAGSINQGQLIALAAAVGFGISIALVKSLTRTESTLSIIFWMLVVQSVAGFAPTLAAWVWPSAAIWGWIVVIAICGTFAHFCLARAMLYADATIVIPMDFLRVPLTATIGWLIYGERLDMLTIAGAALILTGNLLNLKPPAPIPARAEA